jgi:hypothetical protein
MVLHPAAALSLNDDRSPSASFGQPPQSPAQENRGGKGFKAHRHDGYRARQTVTKLVEFAGGSVTYVNQGALMAK